MPKYITAHLGTITYNLYLGNDSLYCHYRLETFINYRTANDIAILYFSFGEYYDAVKYRITSQRQIEHIHNIGDIYGVITRLFSLWDIYLRE